MENKINIKAPEYFKEFKCIGGRCQDSCCIGWDIDIDEATYNEYSKVDNEGINIMLQENMSINNECSNNSIDYAKVKLNESKRCPFLNDTNYCIIHSNLGEGCLSNTCSHFPRVMNKVDDEYEISLDVACPEAARIILNIKDKIKFTKSEEKINKYIVAGEIDTADEEYDDYPIKYFKEIRDFCIRIVQDRSFSLSQRLYILGDFLFRLEESADDDCESVCKFIDDFDIEEAGEIYSRNDLNYIMQLSLFNNLVNDLEIYDETDSLAFKNYTKELLEGFNIKDKDDIEMNSDRYIDAFVDYSRDFIDENSYIFENYIVNFMYNNLFPYSESDSMFEGYIMLLIRYSLMRFYLVGKYLYSRSDCSENIVKFIQVFSKVIEHDKNYMGEILEYIIENEFDNMEFAEMII